MAKRISASAAKNNFGGLLDDVTALGRVDIVKHGRLVAVVLSPGAFQSANAALPAGEQDARWGEKHMIPLESARSAKMLRNPSSFDEE